MYNVKSFDQISTTTVSDFTFSELSDSIHSSSAYQMTGSRTYNRDTECDQIAISDPVGLYTDLRTITDFPELSDVRFLVGLGKVPVYGVKAILMTRSKHFYQLIFSAQKKTEESAKQKKNMKSSVLSKLKSLGRKNPSMPSCQVITVDVRGVQPTVFSDIIRYLHSGRISITAYNVIGVMNTAHSYGLTDLRVTCFEFATRCINLDNILPLLASTLTSSENRWTQNISVKVWDFMKENARYVLALPNFADTRRDVAVAVLSHTDLSVTATERREAACRWSKRQAENTTGETTDLMADLTIDAMDSIYRKENTHLSDTCLSQNTSGFSNSDSNDSSLSDPGLATIFPDKAFVF